MIIKILNLKLLCVQVVRAHIQGKLFLNLKLYFVCIIFTKLNCFMNLSVIFNYHLDKTKQNLNQQKTQNEKGTFVQRMFHGGHP